MYGTKCWNLMKEQVRTVKVAEMLFHKSVGKFPLRTLRTASVTFFGANGICPRVIETFGAVRSSRNLFCRTLY